MEKKISNSFTKNGVNVVVWRKAGHVYAHDGRGAGPPTHARAALSFSAPYNARAISIAGHTTRADVYASLGT
jgi:hypothetical protein